MNERNCDNFFTTQISKKILSQSSLNIGNVRNRVIEKVDINKESNY